jgi:hypothetical protein
MSATPNISLVYDPRYHTWDSWACLMCELYATQNLMMPGPEDTWKDWANGLIAIDVFTNEAVPSAAGFDYWFDWAQELVGAVNPNVEN